MNKSIKEKIKKYFGEFLTIIGTGIFVNNFFRFSYRTEDCSGLGLPALPSLGRSCERITGVVYYYSNDTILWLIIGSVLIITGILIMKNRA